MVADSNARRTEEDHLQEARILLRELPKPTEVLKFSLIQKKALSNSAKAQLVRETLLCRIRDIAGSALSLYESKKRVPAFILTRAVFETAAMMFLVHERLERVRNTGKRGDISVFLSRIGAGGYSREYNWPDGTQATPIRIGKAVKRLEKKFREMVSGKGLDSDYALLSDFAHPNCFGTLLSYAKHKEEDGFITFHLAKPPEQLDELSVGLIALNIGLDIAQHYYRELGSILRELGSVL